MGVGGDPYDGSLRFLHLRSEGYRNPGFSSRDLSGCDPLGRMQVQRGLWFPGSVYRHKSDGLLHMAFGRLDLLLSLSSFTTR